jgi:GDP-4-dehydro-6-deoxy-D-mannose reductase
LSRVLVIGGGGFLGRYIVDALGSRGHRVHTASRAMLPEGTRHRLDVGDTAETTRLLEQIEPEAVVQVVADSSRHSRDLSAVHLEPTLNLVHAAVRSSLRPAILVSGSAAEYGDPGDLLASESSVAQPLTPYGKAKLAETIATLDLAGREGLDLTVFRPFNPVGCDLPVSTALGNFRHQLLGSDGPIRRITVGRVDVVRDFIPAPFVGTVVAELAEIRPGGIVNVCSGVGNRLDALMYAAAALVGVEIQFDRDEELAAVPAPDRVVGDPKKLNSLVKTRVAPTPESLATQLLTPLV